MKRRAVSGLSLLEMVISMWIAGIIIFSTLICTNDFETKIDQHKLQALSIAKSEMDCLRFWAYRGYLMMNKKSGNNEFIRKITKIVYVLDRKIVKLDSKKGTDGSPFYQRTPLHTMTFDSFSESPPLIEYFNIGSHIIKIGGMVDYFESACNTIEKASKFKQQLEEKYLRFFNFTKDNEFNPLTPFVLDINIKGSNDTEHKVLETDDGDIYLYDIVVRVGWFEKRRGQWNLPSKSFSSMVVTDQEPHLLN